MAEKKKNRNRSVDPAVLEVLAETEGKYSSDTAYDRFLNMQPQCSYGDTGICCTICIQGPCRITKKASKGICGAHPYTIVARNLVRHALGGCAAHADHGLHAPPFWQEKYLRAMHQIIPLLTLRSFMPWPICLIFPEKEETTGIF